MSIFNIDKTIIIEDIFIYFKGKKDRQEILHLLVYSPVGHNSRTVTGCRQPGASFRSDMLNAKHLGRLALLSRHISRKQPGLEATPQWNTGGAGFTCGPQQ